MPIPFAYMVNLTLLLRQECVMFFSTFSNRGSNLRVFMCSCDKVYHKQEERFILYFLGQIVTSEYNPNRMDKNWLL